MKEKIQAAVKAATVDIDVILDKVVVNPGVITAIAKRMDELAATIEAMEPADPEAEAAG
jgi:N-acetylglucosamine-6-phosphate deacetylase